MNSCNYLIVLLFYTLLDTSITSPDSRIINIKAHKQLSKIESLRLNLPVQLNSDHQFTDDLISAYDYYMQKKATIIYRRVKFYERISYTFLNSDGNFNSNLDLNIGAVVQIKEENGVSYAIIKAIFTHKYNDDLTYAFIWVDWLQESLTIDPILQNL